MKYCWSYSDNQISLLSPSITLFSAMCISSFIREIYIGRYPAQTSMLLFLFVFLPCNAVFLLIAMVGARKYKIDEKGMTISYPFAIKLHYKWQQFHEVAICKIHYAGGTNAHIVSIRCTLSEEKRGPKKAEIARENWTFPHYHILHFKTVIPIYYTEDRIKEFHHFCPLPITDYRYLKDRS